MVQTIGPEVLGVPCFCLSKDNPTHCTHEAPITRISNVVNPVVHAIGNMTKLQTSGSEEI